MSLKNQQISDFLQKHPHDFLGASSHELEPLVGVSAATIVRFVQTLGYSGMSEMRVELAQQIKHDESAVELVLDKDDSISQLEHKILQLYRDSTEGLRESLNDIQMDLAVKKIKDAKRIFILGVGTSGLIAYDLYHRFNRYGKTTFYETDAHMNLEFMLQSTPDDVILAISYSGITREVVIGAESARERGVTVISILSDPKTPLERASDISLYIPRTENLVRLASLVSRINAMMVSDILFYGVMQEKLPDMGEKINDSNRLVSKLKINNF